MRLPPTFLVAAAAFAAFASGEEAIRFGAPFADGMVLQRGRPVPVWGEAAPGAAIRISFGGAAVEAITDADGAWRTELPPMEASAKPRVLTAEVRGADGAEARIEIYDILVGEVWICSGQSNMELPLFGKNPRFRDRHGPTTAQYLRRSGVRLARVPFAWSADERRAADVSWHALSPESLRETGFSAIGAYFAVEIHDATSVPVGIVGAYKGASGIDSWIPRASLDAHATTLPVSAARRAVAEEDWTADMAEYPFTRPDRQPCVLWNAMVAPLAPMAVRGVLWYQGETNAGAFEWPLYNLKLRALYDGWKAAFRNDALRFYYVQLAPWGDPVVPLFQEWMAKFADEEPNAAVAIANDLGNPTDVHPADKRAVAQRLALHALRRDYGFDLEDCSPTLASWEKRPGGALAVTFAHAKTLYIYNDDASKKGWADFELAGPDCVWHPARIENLPPSCAVEGATLVLRAEGVEAPGRVRYLHNAPWRGTVFNEAGLPLGAFHAGY